ncbi:type III-B CRISPR module RAMP protein Cmr6 [Methylacidimicrobium tartarophylax]|uniref:CRISPR type III-associated protein domain-containing protein n=1 Tax=Methylacidimicrobium tartarophylax TaxID=1041768 RepID=A0A5E6M8W2_9BACT|nr:type III-B CRISPR module RAMP protein Cmr6 [Methylacidimicrobium tartarophylax]VVM05377.1 hypothetical protein MAMT_00629 [Methylacidimicrobium tartarophylax]
MKPPKEKEVTWHLASDTRAVLERNGKLECDSRSLLLDRFVNPKFKKEDRSKFWKKVIETGPCFAKERQKAWKEFVLSLFRPSDLLFGRLRSRLLVNMAGGVMENAGLCLDRFGLPYIPGSAIKGCARRAAIHKLLKESAKEKAVLLGIIALAFGWREGDWSAGDPDDVSSDFAYGCQGEDWEAIRETTAQRLCERLGRRPQPGRPASEALPNFAGTVRFLPAYVHSLPRKDLELDVVTCHHPEYYSGDEKMDVALDCEDPNPVSFCAVAPDAVFAFPVQAVPRGGEDLGATARDWLKAGLEEFGIGAKTAAGYGWFDCSDEVQEEYRKDLTKELEESERARKRATLTPDPNWLEVLAKEREDQLRGRINRFKYEEQYWSEADRNEGYQLTLLHFLTVQNPDLYQKERSNPKSSVLKGLQNLTEKFGRRLP